MIDAVIYLDNNATTRPSAAVRAAAAAALEDHWANPSSVHRFGQGARQLVERSRQSLAELLGVKPRELVLTGSGTESIDLAIRGRLLVSSGALLTAKTEHAAVRDLADELERSGTEVRWLETSDQGVIDPGTVEAALDRGGISLVSIMWANNETGAIQDVAAIGALCAERGVPFHCDATQWVGKMPTDLTDLPIDLLSFSPHKFHGPKGVGVLFARRGTRFRPVIHGSQELGRRGGTENVAGIAAAAAAAEEAQAWLADTSARQTLAALRDHFEQGVLEHCPDARINGPTTPGARLWNTTNLAFRSLEAEVLLLAMSEQGVCASAGAACSSGSLDPSPVLLAMGVDPVYAHGSVRFSLSRETTAEEIDEAIEIVARCVKRAAEIA